MLNWPYRLLRYPFPGDLGLDEDEFWIIDVLKTTVPTVGSILASVNEPVTVMDAKRGIASLLKRGLAFIGGQQPDTITIPETDDEWDAVRNQSIRLTTRGNVIANAVLLKGDWVVYFHKIEEHGEVNCIPIACQVLDDVQLHDEFATIDCIGLDIPALNVVRGSHYTRRRVPCALLMRLNDYTDTFPWTDARSDQPTDLHYPPDVILEQDNGRKER